MHANTQSVHEVRQVITTMSRVKTKIIICKCDHAIIMINLRVMCDKYNYQPNSIEVMLRCLRLQALNG